MFSQCPDCQAIFQVTDAHLKAANGNVRCGQCLTIFNALEHRRDDLLEKDVVSSGDTTPSSPSEVTSQGEALSTSAPANQVTNLNSMSDDQDSTGHPDQTASDASNDFVTSVEDSLDYSVYVESFEDIENPDGLEDLEIQVDELAGETDTVKNTPPKDDATRRRKTDQATARWKSTHEGKSEKISTSSAERKPEIPAAILEQLQAEKAARLRPSNAPWIIGSLLLMVVFLLQGIYFSRNELARNPQLRPWLEKACALAHCSLARPYDIRLVEIINRDVRSDPTEPQALIASTTIINNAEFTQPYPLLTLTFSDITGTRLAQRRFTPEEYLPPDKDIEAGMTPNVPITIELKLVDPGQAAVNFEFIAEADPRRLKQNS